MEAADDPARIAAAAEVDPSQMGWITSTLTASELADIAAYLATFAASEGTVNVVEFYSRTRDHYFMTASAQEIADLDAGVHAGWERTGFSFKASASAVDGTGPVCRFYLPPAFGDSHFYSASTVGMLEASGATYPGFVYETAAALYVGLPDTVTGACAAGTVPIYRVWNNRPDTNHRYTTSLVIRQQMQSQGWIAEGYGPTQVIMCAL